jgi:3-oxoacyl-[acyl-carrier protein] reductase
MIEEQELGGLTVLVTGGTRRIGLAMALECARAGANVVVNYAGDHVQAATAVQAIEALGGRALAVHADVRDGLQVTRLVTTAVDHFGGVDILINNAARRPHAKLSGISLADWHDVLDLIIDGAFLCAKECERHLPRTGRGAILNIGGLVAQLGNGDAPHVSAGKSGLIGLTRALAQHFGPLGVTVNCLTPGSIVAADDDAERRGRAPSVDKIPLRRVGTPQDIAGAARAIVGPRFRFLTGQTVHINGGVFMS